MEIFYGIKELPGYMAPVLTIGTFDGVHQGHKMILESVVHEARLIGGTSILITFHPHPRKLISPDEPLKLLSTLPERLALIEAAGIDVTVVVPFTHDFAALSAQDYIRNFLLHLFHPAAIVIGYDHHFGHDRTGDMSMLKAYAQQHTFQVKEIPAQLISLAAVSSTQIRKALLEGRVAAALTMLGAPYCITGSVIRGAQRGRSIGYPTANIAVPDTDKLIPMPGVYAVQVYIEEQRYLGMLNLGVNPTVVSDNIIKIEVNIFDFNRDIYDCVIRVCFIDRIRDEQKFADLNALKIQLGRDKQSALQLLDP